MTSSPTLGVQGPYCISSQSPSLSEDWPLGCFRSEHPSIIDVPPLTGLTSLTLMGILGFYPVSHVPSAMSTK